MLMNNYCQLPGGVHQFFSYLLWRPSLLSAAETSAACRGVWTCLVNDSGSRGVAPTGPGAVAFHHGPWAVPLPSWDASLPFCMMLCHTWVQKAPD